MRLFQMMMVLVAIAAEPIRTQAQWTTGSGGTIYYNGGNVGVGTASPATPLNVESVLRVSNAAVTTSRVDIYGGRDGTNSSSIYIYTANQSSPNVYLGDGTYNSYINLNGGNFGIGTNNPQYKLSVNGTIQAKEVIVNTGWSDYVFSPQYHLPTLPEVSRFIQAHHHLSGIPSEAEIGEKGVSLGEIQSKLLAKIEELTLQLIKEHDRNDKLEKAVRKLEEAK